MAISDGLMAAWLHHIRKPCVMFSILRQIFSCRDVREYVLELKHSIGMKLFCLHVVPLFLSRQFFRGQFFCYCCIIEWGLQWTVGNGGREVQVWDDSQRLKY
jgi:hypothetical protein